MDHESVLLSESVEGLVWDPSGVYVDCTFGAGGHSGAVLEELGVHGRVLALDRDDRVSKYDIEDDRFELYCVNYCYVREVLDYLGYIDRGGVHGVLLDLGVSSMQLDREEYGMAYRFDAQLDMRMSSRQQMTARDVVNGYSQEELARILKMYGEVSNPWKLSKEIVKARSLKQIETTLELAGVVEGVLKVDRYRGLSQVFQAIRMEVNDELESLKVFLESVADCLCVGGRIAVITFHSLEDRMVKRFLKQGGFLDEVRKDEYGQVFRRFELINKKPIEASVEERSQNRRARSAKLRIARKVG